jgi:hypothetical protein
VARRVCDLENLMSKEAIARVVLQRHIKRTYNRNEFPLQYALPLCESALIEILVLHYCREERSYTGVGLDQKVNSLKN